MLTDRVTVIVRVEFAREDYETLVRAGFNLTTVRNAMKDMAWSVVEDARDELKRKQERE
jgi:hypothetical protein